MVFLVEFLVLRRLDGELQADQEPGARQQGVVPQAAPKGVEPRRRRFGGHEEPVVGEDQKREHDRTLLGGHRPGRRCHAAGEPCDGPPPASRPRRRLRVAGQRHQAEHPRHRFDPLVDVGHRLRLERVHSPDHRDHHRQRHRAVTPAATEPWGKERDPDDGEERQGRDHVDQQVRDVVAEGPHAPDCTIDREREVGQRPRRQLVADEHRVPGREQLLERRVVLDVLDVIEDELACERIEKCNAGDDRNEESRLADGEGAGHGRHVPWDAGDAVDEIRRLSYIPSIAASAAAPTSTSAQPMERAIGGRSE